ncbi:hypothetical protein [Pelagibius marinus]|uniref:hypothetical protein n=1 Tax=Pelagibius marinus TaxID=2762760 RepID=UPI001872E702|nr:hypothetical protein [Pelagibius marinus]
MRLINAENGRVLSLFSQDDIQPQMGYHLPDIVEGIVARYLFASFPEDKRLSGDSQEGPLRFKTGRFVHSNTPIYIHLMDVYRDGVVVEATSTDYAEIVADDLLSWAEEQFGFRFSEASMRRVYTSSVVVEFDLDVNYSLAAFEQVSAAYTAAMRRFRAIDETVNVTKIQLGVDPTRLTSRQLGADFIIERRVNCPHDSNRFFCDAPLPTLDHVELLKTFEALLKTGRGS